MILDADQDTTITADTDDRVDIKVAGTDTVHIDASGIGVNINNPLYPLHVTEASGGDTAAIFIDGPTDGTSALHMGDSDDIDIGSIQYDHSSNFMSFRTNATEALRLQSAVTGSGFTADTGTSVMSHPIHAIRASGMSRTDSYYDFTVDTNGGLYVIAGMSHDQSPTTYGEFANFQVGHNATNITVNTSESYGGNGSIALTKSDNNTLRVTFNKSESSGSGSYATIEFVAVFGANPF